jgi:anti-anti-sigma regulatory factor
VTLTRVIPLDGARLVLDLSKVEFIGASTFGTKTKLVDQIADGHNGQQT